jgi:hypothetical protein
MKGVSEAKKISAKERVCPVEICKAGIGEECFSPLIVRGTGKPFGPIGLHFERVFPEWKSTLSAI